MANLITSAILGYRRNGDPWQLSSKRISIKICHTRSDQPQSSLIRKKIELLFFWFVSEEYMVSFKYVRVNVFLSEVGDVNIYDLLELIKAMPITVLTECVQDHANMIGRLSWIKR